MADWMTCELCGFVHFGVSIALVAWRDPELHDGQLFGSVPRCLDAVACQRRVEDAGHHWPLGRPADRPRSHLAELVEIRRAELEREALGVPIAVVPEPSLPPAPATDLRDELAQIFDDELDDDLGEWQP